MTCFLTRLVDRTLGVCDVVQPLVRPLLATEAVPEAGRSAAQLFAEIADTGGETRPASSQADAEGVSFERVTSNGSGSASQKVVRREDALLMPVKTERAALEETDEPADRGGGTLKAGDDGQGAASERSGPGLAAGYLRWGAPGQRRGGERRPSVRIAAEPATEGYGLPTAGDSNEVFGTPQTSEIRKDSACAMNGHQDTAQDGPERQDRAFASRGSTDSVEVERVQASGPIGLSGPPASRIVTPGDIRAASRYRVDRPGDVSARQQHDNEKEQRGAYERPTVKIMIGRIDVRAVRQSAPAPAGQRRISREPTIALHDYLRRRPGDGQ